MSTEDSTTPSTKPSTGSDSGPESVPRRPFAECSEEARDNQADEVAWMAENGHLRPVGDPAGCEWHDWDTDTGEAPEEDGQ